MLLGNKRRLSRSFQVPLEGHDPTEDQDAYVELLSNPLVTILEKKWVKKRNEKWTGYGEDKTGDVDELWFVVVDYEERSV